MNPSDSNKNEFVVKSTSSERKVAISLRRVLPKGHYVRRPRRSVHTLVPFIRTLANAFADLERAARKWRSPQSAKVIPPTKRENVPRRQKAVDDELHAAKHRATLFAAALKASAESTVSVDGKMTARSRVIKQLAGTEKYLAKLKDTRGKIQTSPKKQFGLEEETTVKKTGRSPSYLRRLELRRLRREVEELKSQPMPSSDLTVKEVVVEKVVEKEVSIPLDVVPCDSLLLLQSNKKLRMGMNLPEKFVMAEFTCDVGTIRFTRSKPDSRVTAFDFLEKGRKPCRLGKLTMFANDTFLELTAVELTPSALFILGAVYSFPETLPAPFPEAVSNFKRS